MDRTTFSLGSLALTLLAAPARAGAPVYNFSQSLTAFSLTASAGSMTSDHVSNDSNGT